MFDLHRWLNQLLIGGGERLTLELADGRLAETVVTHLPGEPWRVRWADGELEDFVSSHSAVWAVERAEGLV